MAPRGDGQFPQGNNEDIEGQGRVDVEEDVPRLAFD